MTPTELAKILSVHIAQGRGDWQMAVFQWDHGSQPVTDILIREGCELLELYSEKDQTACTELDDLI